MVGALMRWTKALDQHLAEEAPASSKRSLAMHLSDVSTAPADSCANDYDDVISIATTVTWNLGASVSKRCPQNRPSRRARRTAKLREERDTVELLAMESIREVDWESGSLPLDSIPALIACLDDSDEDGFRC